MTVRRALVLGGGGVAGIAWITGMLVGAAEEGIDVTGADLIVGTSAGSSVAAQIGSGLPLAELYERQVDPARSVKEIVPEGLNLAELWEKIGAAVTSTPDPVEQRRRVAAMALATETVTEAARRAVIEQRLPSHEWPERDLRIPAVNAATGETVIFDRRSGVTLVDAVAASCAVPGVWPPVTIGPDRYVDGGVRTMTNADLAEGYDRILVLAPLDSPEIPEQVEALRKSARVELILPDESAQKAFGDNPLDPATRPASAVAGAAQGRTAARAITALWTGTSA